MAHLNVGLMGFGRVGRNLCRMLLDDEKISLAAISARQDPAGLVHLLRYDSILGPLSGNPGVKDGKLSISGCEIPLFDGAEPGDVPWGDLGVHTVIDTAHKRRTREEIQRHLDQGAQRVILCAPPVDPPDITAVMGLNDNELKRDHRIVSNGTSTSQCMAPIIKILDDAFGIERAFLSAIHAYTENQVLSDVPNADMRRGRAAAVNIIPLETVAGTAIERAMPGMAGKLTATAMHVPVPNGSAADLVCWHNKPVTTEAINAAIREAANGKFKGIIDYVEAPIVSSDVLCSSYSSIFDSMATMAQREKISKTIAWFDNGWSYAQRLVDLMNRFIELEREAA